MPEERIKKFFTYKHCTWLILYVFYLQFLVSEALEGIWKTTNNTEVPELFSLICIQIFAVLLPCAVFFLYTTSKPTEIIKLKQINKIHALICVILGISAQPIASLLNTPAVIHAGGTTAVVSTPANFAHLLGSLISIALLPAIFEEILVRGIIFYSLEKRGYRLTLIVTSLIFAILHNNPTNFWGMFFLGLILCYATWMTQSIYSAMLIHFSFNACGLIADYIVTNSAALHPWIVSNTFSIIIIIISVFILFFFLSMINRKFIRRYKTKNLIGQIILSFLNVPILLVIMGYFMFNLIR